jgi:predicted nucleic acid-binding protein
MPEFLRERRAAVLARWEELILQGYPEQSARFFRDEKDPFHNPVGATVRESIGVLYDHLLAGTDSSALAEALDRMIRLRSVQEFTPAQAVSFPFLLKSAVAEVLGEEEVRAEAERIGELHTRIDQLALRGVDVYAACRERLYEIRARDAIARTYSLLRRAGAVEEEVASEADGDGGPRRRARLKGGHEA